MAIGIYSELMSGNFCRISTNELCLFVVSPPSSTRVVFDTEKAPMKYDWVWARVVDRITDVLVIEPRYNHPGSGFLRPSYRNTPVRVIGGGQIFCIRV